MSAEAYYLDGLNGLADSIRKWRIAKGFYSADAIKGEIPDDHLKQISMSDLMLSKLALMHEELGEASHAVRNGNFDDFAEELADCLIRILETCATAGIDIAGQVELKMRRNEGRPYRHGRTA